MINIGDIPFSSLKVGDRVISCTGKHGTIGAIFSKYDPWNNQYDDQGGAILFLWNHQTPQTYSISGHYGSEVKYLGDTDYSDPCNPLCNWKREKYG